MYNYARMFWITDLKLQSSSQHLATLRVDSVLQLPSLMLRMLRSTKSKLEMPQVNDMFDVVAGDASPVFPPGHNLESQKLNVGADASPVFPAPTSEASNEDSQTKFH